MNSENVFYTYFHTRNDTGEIFYVGKGKGRRAQDTKRNKYWRAIYEKFGRTVHIYKNNLSESEAFEYERILISQLKAMRLILANFTNGGEGVSGLVFTAEHRAAIAKKGLGRKHSKDTLEKMSIAQKGRSFSTETKLKMSQSAKARKAREGNCFFASSTTQEQIFEWHKKSAKAQVGKTFSDEHRAKISAAGIGRVSANKGKILPFEWRAKMSMSGKGRPKSEEHKAKIKAAHMARNAILKSGELQ